MTAPRGLMGVGLPAQLAKRIGFDSTPAGSTLNGAGTSQATAAAIGQFQFYVRGVGTASTGIAYVLPNNAEQGSEYMIINTTATMVLYPPVGGTWLMTGIGVTATGVSISVGKGGSFMCVTASTFDAFLNS